jgi:hypothetical protein
MSPDNPVSPGPETEAFGDSSKARLPRRKLGRGTLALLILLRVYVFLAVPVVVYAFIRALHR